MVDVGSLTLGVLRITETSLGAIDVVPAWGTTLRPCKGVLVKPLLWLVAAHGPAPMWPQDAGQPQIEVRCPPQRPTGLSWKSEASSGDRESSASRERLLDVLGRGTVPRAGALPPRSPESLPISATR